MVSYTRSSLDLLLSQSDLDPTHKKPSVIALDNHNKDSEENTEADAGDENDEVCIYRLLRIIHAQFLLIYPLL